ncbi:cupin domain-containing protein [Burkholderia cenocepacia]|nr:cupin domain-containing protein [Burkholderia cenocepacia]
MCTESPKFFCKDSASVPWLKSRLAAGVEVKNLGKTDGRAMQLVRFAPGTVFPDHLHTGSEFLYILEGEAVQNGHRLSRGWSGIAERGTVDHGFKSEKGCTFILIYELRQFNQ